MEVPTWLALNEVKVFSFSFNRTSRRCRPRVVSLWNVKIRFGSLDVFFCRVPTSEIDGQLVVHVRTRTGEEKIRLERPSN